MNKSVYITILRAKYYPFVSDGSCTRAATETQLPVLRIDDIYCWRDVDRARFLVKWCIVLPDLITLMKENRDLTAQFVCVVCFQDERDVVFLPCGHVVSCQVCYNVGGFLKCPVCNTVIERDIISKKGKCECEVSARNRQYSCSPCQMPNT